MPRTHDMFMNGRPPQVFCVGLAKCGTHSIADMLDPACRAAHEPESEALLPLLEPARSGKIAVGELRSLLRDRDRRLRLDFEANHLLGSFVPHLVDAFPHARFILLVRELRPWIDSLINDQLNLRVWDGYSRWRVVYDQYLRGEKRVFPLEEAPLRDLDLYPISHYIRYWRDEPKAIVAQARSDRLLVLRTEELAGSVSKIAEFLGLQEDSLASMNTHTYPTTRKHNVLESLDPRYLYKLLADQALASLTRERGSPD